MAPAPAVPLAGWAAVAANQCVALAPTDWLAGWRRRRVPVGVTVSVPVTVSGRSVEYVCSSKFRALTIYSHGSKASVRPYALREIRDTMAVHNNMTMECFEDVSTSA